MPKNFENKTIFGFNLNPLEHYITNNFTTYNCSLSIFKIK